MVPIGAYGLLVPAPCPRYCTNLSGDIRSLEDYMRQSPTASFSTDCPEFWWWCGCLGLRPRPTNLLYRVASANHRLKQSIIYRRYRALDCCNKAIKGAGTQRGEAEESRFSDCCTEYLYIHTYIGILHEWWCGTRPESQKKVHTIRLMGPARNKEMVKENLQK
jgi:hypothetical protein